MTRIAAAISLLLTLSLSRASFANDTTISFESFPGTQPFGNFVPLDVQYGPLGVYFDYLQPNVPILSNAFLVAHSPSFIVLGPDWDQEFGDNDFRINFSSAQSLVQLFGASGSCLSTIGTLTAFGSDNVTIVAPVDSESFVITTPGSVATPFSVSTNDPRDLVGQFPCGANGSNRQLRRSD